MTRSISNPGITLSTLFMLLVVSTLCVATYRRNRVWSTPVTLWADASDKSQTKPRTLYNYAVALTKAKRLDEAYVVNRAVVSIAPEYSDAHFNLGVIYHQFGILGKAIEEYETALAIDITKPRAHNNLGYLYYTMGREDEAMAQYKLAIMFQPGHSKAHYNIGLIYTDRGMRNEAELMYKKALSLDPGNSYAYRRLGDIHREKGMLELAIAEYKAALALNPGLASAYSGLGIAYEKKGLIREAVRQYKKALAVEPGQDEANERMIEILRRGPGKGLTENAAP